MMSADLDYRVEDCLALITLRRPQTLNAFTYPMVAEFRALVRRAEADPAVIALAVTGEGRAFCAGLDIGVLAAEAGNAAGAVSRLPVEPGDLPALFSFLLRVSKPVFAAINGVTAGGGFVLAMMCDMRFAAEEASFTTVFSHRGLIAEHGMSWLLPRQIGTSRALDLLWSSRRVSSAEALQLGLVDRVVPGATLLDAVLAYARELRAKSSPRSLAEMKAQVYAHLSSDFATAVHDAARRMEAALGHPDATEGSRSFVERRAPRFLPWSRDS